MRISKAGKKDLSTLMAIFNACTEDLKSRGQHHWDDIYTEDVVTGIVEQGGTWIIRREKPIATFTLLEKPLFGSEKYWKKAPEKKALYFSALGVIPDEQGRGVGSYACRQAELMTAERGFSCLRLNAPHDLKDFYISLGFRTVRRVMEDGLDFFLLEKEASET